MTNQEICDKSGSILQPFDMVRIGDIPEHYWSDDHFSQLRLYAGGYGLTTYFGEQFQYLGRDNHSAWLSPDSKHINVFCVRAAEDAVCSYSFWLPVNSIEKIGYNLVLANLFTRLPLQMEKSNGETIFTFGSDTHFYELVRRISKAPLGDLEQINDYVLQALKK